MKVSRQADFLEERVPENHSREERVCLRADMDD
jgi:hypothetical protein